MVACCSPENIFFIHRDLFCENYINLPLFFACLLHSGRKESCGAGDIQPGLIIIDYNDYNDVISYLARVTSLFFLGLIQPRVTEIRERPGCWLLGGLAAGSRSSRSHRSTNL